MTNPTDTPEAPPRWRLEPTLTTDQAPSAFPMREDEDTACQGDDPAPELDPDVAFTMEDATGVLLPDPADPFADLAPLLAGEKLDDQPDDEPPPDADPADPDGGPERPEQEAP